MNDFLAAEPTFQDELNTVCNWFYMRGWKDGTMHPVPTKMLAEGTLSAETVGKTPDTGFTEAVFEYALSSKFFENWGIVEGDDAMQEIQTCYISGYDARQSYDTEQSNKLFTKQYYIGTGVGVGLGILGGALVTYLIMK